MKNNPMKPAAMRAAAMIPTLAMLLAVEKRQGQLTANTLFNAAIDAGCHPRTLRRQMAKYKLNSTVSNLVGQRGFPKGKPRLSSRVIEIVTQCIDKYYAASPPITISALMSKIEEALKTVFGEDFKIPSRSAVKNQISKLEYRRLVLKREGRTSAERFSPRPNQHVVHDPWAVWQIDETPIDIIPVTDDRRHSLKRLWLTLIIDIATRLIVGWSIDFRGPNAVSVARAILSAALPKQAVILPDGSILERPWSGLPYKIQLDRHSSHRHAGLLSFCENRGIDLDFGFPGQPWVRGHIERVIGTFMKKVHSLPGTTFSDPKARGDYNSELKAVLTISELTQWFELAIASYNSSTHSSISMPPISAWASAAEAGLFVPIPVVNEDSLRLELLPQRLVTIRRTGIHLHGLRYWNEALRQDILSQATKVIIRYDPHDVRVLWLARPNGTILSISARGAEGEKPIDEWTLQAVRKAARNDGITLQDQALLRATRRAMDDLVSKAAASTSEARHLTRLGHLNQLKAGPFVDNCPTNMPPSRPRNTAWNRVNRTSKREE